MHLSPDLSQVTATQLRELVKGVVESHATHNTFYSIWSDVKDRETELTYPCAIWDQWRARLTEDEFGQLHRAILVRLLIVTVVATDRQPIARDTAVEAADNAAADYVLKIRQDYPDLVITNVSTTTQFDEYTQLETGVLLTMTVEGEGLCLDSDHFEPGIPGECVPGAVRNSDDTYTASVASGGTLTLPDVTHTDSDGSAVSTPAMVPFVATACVGALPATARLRQTGGAQIGGDYTIPAGGSLDITAPDGEVTVRNSTSQAIGTGSPMSGQAIEILIADGVFRIKDSAGDDIGAAHVPAAGSAEGIVADSTITKTDGTTVGLRATQPLDVRSYRSGILYDWSGARWSGQVTSHRFGDEGTAYATLFFRHSNVPVYPAQIAALGSTWTTLASLNRWGDNRRFTDRGGGNTYADRIIHDHLTDLYWYSPTTPPTGNWHTAIDAAVASTAGGLTGWLLPPMQALQTIINNQGGTLLNYAPFAIAGVGLLTSTSVPTSGTFNAMPMLPTGAFQSVSKNASHSYIFCRKADL